MEELYYYMFSSLQKRIKKINQKVPQPSLFMFKKKKSNLIKKIWKYTKLSAVDKDLVADIKSKLRSLLKTFSEVELDTLLKSLQSNGGIETDCILVKSSELRHYIRHTHSEPKLLLARSFRFPQLTTSSDYLRSLICCQKNSCMEEECGGCLNPHHSSLVVDTESPLPPYSENPGSNLPSLSTTSAWSSPRESLSRTLVTEFTTGSSCCGKQTAMASSSGESYHYDSSMPWCRITYWEQKHRVGRIFDVTNDCVNVFENLLQGDGLCLGLLDHASVPQTEASDKVRDNIGYGFQLTREADGVWLYNRSNVVLFTGSPTIQTESVGVNTPVVKRLPPGTSIMVLDPNLLLEVNEKYKQLDHRDNSLTCSYDLSETSEYYPGKVHPFCVRVSFGKGWGVNYTRMSITQCPCWVEIYLNVCASTL